ncbi:hypothetical protein A3C87_02715 [Candidatus Kaiserbacteria bacterium RIFCSPHIGHO2_02_FULL_49_34]|uniref:Transcriptional repressor n=1 Tax=Candidatus Kaiserbacteria bacterium RIFCSPHIGHO2_02_FULL_49_34 TaxID=1798491 RepID=A0A1F6DJG8_9BACT|nr:MAG: hypothetical protein A3C87_02715 [Candidatus Kaiserbacteria bacterium RIFCSPHIGHO2_02_FULL_49_34]
MRTNTWGEHILEVLKKSHTMTLAELGKKIPAADQSTLFRNAERLVKDGALRKIVVNQRTSAYELVTENHQHDHFVCDDCEEVSPIEMPRPKGLQKIRDVVVRGVCAPCIKEKKK